VTMGDELRRELQVPRDGFQRLRCGPEQFECDSCTKNLERRNAGESHRRMVQKNNRWKKTGGRERGKKRGRERAPEISLPLFLLGTSL